MSEDKAIFTLKGEDLPYNLEAEAVVIGGMLFNNDIIPTIMQKLTGADFHAPVNERLFNIIAKFHDKGTHVSPVTIGPVVKNDPLVKQAGGARYLMEITTNVAGASIGIHDIVDQVLHLSARRRVITAYAEAVERISSSPGDEEDDLLSSVDAVSETIADLTAEKDRVKVRTVGGAAEAVRARYHRIQSGETPAGAACLTIPTLKNVIGLVEASTLNIIGGRPGQGKTTAAVSAALGYAANGFPVEFIHLEMSDEQFDLRVVSDISEMIGMPILHSALKAGKLGSAEMKILDRIGEVEAMLPISFTKAQAYTDIKRLDAIVARAKRKWERRGKKLWGVFVDYLQIIGASQHGKAIENDFERVTAVCKHLNFMKERYDVAVFATCQLSRDVDRRTDKRPTMADLKQSGQLEQDADSILFTYRPEYYLQQAEPAVKEGQEYEEWRADFEAVRDMIELIGAKNRHGAPANQQVKFHKDYYAVRSKDRIIPGMDPLLQEDLFYVRDDENLDF